MIEIIPAVLPHSFADLEEHLAKVQGVAKKVQIDIVDGVFAPGKTWPYRDRSTFDTIVEQEHGLPFWESLDFEFDLMVEAPCEELMNVVHTGASRVVVHAGSHGAAAALQMLVDLREDTGAFSVQAGVALAAHAQPDELEPFEAQFDFVQVMGIEHEGRQGEPFDPDDKALFLLQRLRRRYPALPIQVDGGVTLDNAPQLVAAGATQLVVGSAIFGAGDAALAYKALYTKVNVK